MSTKCTHTLAAAAVATRKTRTHHIFAHAHTLMQTASTHNTHTLMQCHSRQQKSTRNRTHTDAHVLISHIISFHSIHASSRLHTHTLIHSLCFARTHTSRTHTTKAHRGRLYTRTRNIPRNTGRIETVVFATFTLCFLFSAIFFMCRIDYSLPSSDHFPDCAHRLARVLTRYVPPSNPGHRATLAAGVHRVAANGVSVRRHRQASTSRFLSDSRCV